MFNKRNINKYTALVAAALLFPIAAIHGADAIRGRVHAQDGDTIHVCFYRGTTPAVGEEFAVVRHTLFNVAKSPTAIRSENVGEIRVTSLDSSGCAEAVLLRGHVQSLDWVADGS